MSVSTQSFQSRFTTADAAKQAQENFIAQKTAPEKLPLLKKFLLKMDPANIRLDDNGLSDNKGTENPRSLYGDLNDPRSVASQMKQHLESMQNPDHITAGTITATNKEDKILGTMSENADKKGLKRLGVSIIPAGFLGMGAMLGLAVTPLVGQIAFGISAIGLIATYIGVHKDEKEIKAVSKMLENTRTSFANKNFMAMEAKRDLKESLEQQGSANEQKNPQRRSRLMTGSKL